MPSRGYFTLERTKIAIGDIFGGSRMAACDFSTTYGEAFKFYTPCPAVYELVQPSHELKLPQQYLIDTDESSSDRHIAFIA